MIVYVILFRKIFVRVEFFPGRWVIVGVFYLFGCVILKISIISFFEVGFLCVCLRCGDYSKRCLAVNVYAKCSLVEK